MTDSIAIENYLKCFLESHLLDNQRIDHRNNRSQWVKVVDCYNTADFVVGNLHIPLDLRGRNHQNHFVDKMYRHARWLKMPD